MKAIVGLLTSPKARGQLRHILTFLAGIAVAKGSITQETVDAVVGNLDSVMNAVGVLLGAAGAIWSYTAKKPESSETQHIVKNG